MKQLSLLLWSLWGLTLSTYAQLPDQVSITLSTDGDLSLVGSPRSDKVSTNQGQKPEKERLIKQFGESKEVKIFTTPADVQKSKRHEKLEVNIPTRSSVRFRTQEGAVTLSDLEASLTGQARRGSLVLNRLKGEVDLVLDQGDIQATEVEARGLLIARQGNIHLTDVTGLVDARAPQGRLAITIGPTYYKKRPQPLAIELEAADVEITSAPYGGNIRLGNGSLAVSKVSAPLRIEADEASISLREVGAALTVKNRGAINVQLVPFEEKSGESQDVAIEAQNGDVTLELAKNFVGTLQLWFTEDNPVSTQAPITSTIALGTADVVENSQNGGKVLVRETFYWVIVGRGAGPLVVVHVTNGKITLKN
ncbi:hypothetical protein GCM10027275_10350 [Rhabdobacter roseus]|uniref:Adhesin domain-containing protein n=1 Tax=Rhabdobacter roseus TaxID=1655419 RepID=A0A840TP00_9BACT|nr:DUF4097 family beta strand repeat-containing protein [Rhabdobacter roseus]MBB5282943.1 hypothetical protein [Rhabdobacter roseus]